MIDIGRFPDWYGDADCAEVGGDFWFPEAGDNGDEAKAICRRCPVRVECGEHAVAKDIRFGIWGAVGEQERGGGVARPGDPPELVQTIKRMAANGVRDPQIGRALDMPADRVRRIRKRNNIPPGRFATRRGDDRAQVAAG